MPGGLDYNQGPTVLGTVQTYSKRLSLLWRVYTLNGWDRQRVGEMKCYPNFTAGELGPRENMWLTQGCTGCDRGMNWIQMSVQCLNHKAILPLSQRGSLIPHLYISFFSSSYLLMLILYLVCSCIFGLCKVYWDAVCVSDEIPLTALL